MKVKKNKKMRFSSKSRYFLTLALLAGLVGNPLLQGTTVLAESFSPDTSLVTADEMQLPDVLNPEVPEIPEIPEPEDTTEEKEPSQPEDEDEVVKVPTPEEKPVPPVSEDKRERLTVESSSIDLIAVIEHGVIWGGVSATLGVGYAPNWDGLMTLQTVLVIHGGTITNPRAGFENPESWWGGVVSFHGAIIFDGDVNVAPGTSLSGLFSSCPDSIGGPFTVNIINLPRLDTTGVTEMSFMFTDVSVQADVSQLNTSAVTTMESMFNHGRFDLAYPPFSSWDTRQVTNMRNMFRGVVQRNPGNLSFPPNFDTSIVTDMSGMFSDVWGIEHLDLSMFNTRKVMDMSGMFTRSWFGSLDLTSFETGNVTNMNSMFSSMGASWHWAGTPSWETIRELDLSSFDTSQVTNMQHMFSNIPRLERVNLSSFDTSSVVPGGMNFMFNHSNSLRELTLGPDIQSMAGTSLMPIPTSTGEFTGNWRNVGTGTVERPNGSHIWAPGELQSNFNGSQADTFVWQPNVPMILGQVEYSYDEPTKTLTLKGGTITNPAATAWGNVPREEVEHIVFTGNVNVGGNRSLFNLFGEMRVLETIDNLSYLDTRGVTNMAWMFRGAAGQTNNFRLKELDLSSFDTSSVTNMAMMFHAAIALTELDVSSFDTSAVRDMGDMFSHASSLQEIKGLDSFKTGAVTDMQGMFRNTAVSDLDLSSFDTRQVTDMNAMFAEMPNISSLDLSSFETSNVRLMTYMFAESRNLEKIDLSTFDTQQVTNMGMMFMHTQSIDKLDLSHFKTENVRDMNHMFAGARDLEELLLDKDNFDTSSVTDMFRMFAHTRNLKSLDLRGFDTRAVTNMEEMFWLADALTELDLPSFETPALTRMEAMFDGASALRKIDMSSFDTRNVQANNRTRLFSDINALDELRLGANTVITNSDLPTETTSTGLLNSWKRETQGFEAFTGPNTLFDFSTGPIIGNNVLRGPADWLSSQDLMTLSGTAGEATGTWRRVPYQTNVQVKDSSIFIGEDWQPEDNFVSATDRYGESVPFNRITVEGTVDTARAGTYKVTYVYDGVEETAKVTVKARGGNGNGASNGGENNKETSTDNLPRTGEIVGLLSILGLANLMLALTLWFKRRKVK